MGFHFCFCNYPGPDRRAPTFLPPQAGPRVRQVPSTCFPREGSGKTRSASPTLGRALQETLRLKRGGEWGEREIPVGLSSETHFMHQSPRLSFRPPLASPSALPWLPLLPLCGASDSIWVMSLSQDRSKCLLCRDAPAADLRHAGGP